MNQILRKTKIVCTVGPATDKDEVMRQMMQAGMNVARFNFSHANYEKDKIRFEQVARLYSSDCQDRLCSIDSFRFLGSLYCFRLLCIP